MGRMGRAVREDVLNIQIKVNQTQVRDVMGHPVNMNPSIALKIDMILS